MRTLAVAALTWCALGVAHVGESSDLEGAWEFVSGTFTDSNGTVEMTKEDRTALKIIAGGHFSFIAREGDEAYAHAGSCRVVGNKYTEHVEVATNPDLVGQTYTFESEVEGDTWTMSGELANLGLTLKEVWHRAK